MTAPMEYWNNHDWELKGSGQLKSGTHKREATGYVFVPWKEGDPIVNYEEYNCKDCPARATKWIDDPKTKDKLVFNPSGGCGHLGYDVPCEMAASFSELMGSVESFLKILKNSPDSGLSPTYTYSDRLRKYCVEIIMQSMVDQCNHSDIEIKPKSMMIISNPSIEQLSCRNCGGICSRMIDESPEDVRLLNWSPEWWGFQSSLEKHVETYVKALQSQESIKNEET